MTIRFAPARKLDHAAIVRHARRMTWARAANDNFAAPSPQPTLDAALRHFARHGLAAAEHARDKAQAARIAGEAEQSDWWLAICRMLDRRMADAFAAGLTATR